MDTLHQDKVKKVKGSIDVRDSYWNNWIQNDTFP